MLFRSIVGEPLPFRVEAVASATSLTLSAAAVNTDTGLEYAIDPAPHERNLVLYSEPDEEESVLPQHTVAIQDNTGDSDEITSLSGHGASMLVGKERHLYSLTFFRQPNIDAKATPIERRGVLNNRCQTVLEQGVYLWDQMGFYRVSPDGGVEPIGLPLGDLFRPSSSERIHWANQKWFFVVADPVLELVKFYYQLVGDAGARPKRWAEYHTRTESWWTCSASEAQGAGCVAPHDDGRLRLFLGGQEDAILLADEGTTDGVAAEVRGTATSATSTTLTDSTASFTDSVIGAPVAIVAGTGKGQVRRITARTGTQLTVAAWDTTPDATSEYLIGAIGWQMQTGKFDLGAISEGDETYTKRSLRLRYRPTAGNVTLDTRRQFNEDSTPRTHTQDQQVGNGFAAQGGTADAVLALGVNRSSQAPQTGFAEWTFGGYGDDKSLGADRSVAIELRGFQGDDAIRIYDLALDGVA